jgi:hypothetical protein
VAGATGATGPGTAIVGVAHVGVVEGSRHELPHDQQTMGLPQTALGPTIVHYPKHVNPLPLEVTVIGLALATPVVAVRERLRLRRIFNATLYAPTAYTHGIVGRGRPAQLPPFPQRNLAGAAP